MKAELPTGTVTFLFTDIEGSTRLLHRLGPEVYADALAEHRQVLRQAFHAHGGVEVDTQGDAFFVAFPTAAGAAAAARAARDALTAGPIRVRMGLHTGEPMATAEGYVGIDVHRGARVAALAHGGQIVLTQATGVLVEEPVTDLGSHRLKDFDGPVRIYQLGTEPFPALRTPGAVDLPTPATPFQGREVALHDAVSIWLDHDPRVLTIVGPGGIGKTRFAIELARLLADDATGATMFVPLASLRDPMLVLSTLAERLGAAGPNARDIAAAVGGRRTHVVLDNLEQLLPGAAPLVSQLVAASPALRLITTSREPLRISGESELDLPPVTHEESVRLFVERARAVRPDLERDPEVEEVCRRLDGLPLAIELAAARTKLLSPAQLLDRLGERLDLLRGTRDADERHATLRATITWSYDLLDPEEQELFARLAVFRAGCTLERAERVCDADVDRLASLLDKSLVRRRRGRLGEERVWMLETIREFAEERLAELGDQDVRRRHAAALLDLVESANVGFQLEGGEQQFDLVFAELDDIRAAIDWACACDAVTAAELVAGLEHVWVTHLPEEGLQHARAVLAHGDAVPPRLQARAWRIQGAVLVRAGEREAGEESYRKALELFRALGDRAEEAGILTRFAVHAANDANAPEARRLVDEARALLGPAPAPAIEAQHLSTLATLAEVEQDFDAAFDLYGQAAESAAACDFALWETWSRLNQLQVALAAARLDDGEQAGRETLRLARRTGDREAALFAAAGLARLALLRGDGALGGRIWQAVRADVETRQLHAWAHAFEEFTAELREETDAAFLSARDADVLSFDELVSDLLREAQTEP